METNIQNQKIHTYWNHYFVISFVWWLVLLISLAVPIYTGFRLQSFNTSSHKRFLQVHNYINIPAIYFIYIYLVLSSVSLTNNFFVVGEWWILCIQSSGTTNWNYTRLTTYIYGAQYPYWLVQEAFQSNQK